MPESPHGTSSRSSCDSPGFACEQLSPATKVCVRLKVKVKVLVRHLALQGPDGLLCPLAPLSAGVHQLDHPANLGDKLVARLELFISSGTVLCLVEPESLKLDLNGLPEYG